MKRNVLLATLLAISSVAASGKSIVISPSPNITRNAGTDIPFVFTASGFAAGATATIYLVNAKTWVATVVEENVPVVNGVNNHPVRIPWSWPRYFPPINIKDPSYDPGEYNEVTGAIGANVLKIVSGTAHATDARVVTIRSAVIWPYFKTVYPRNSDVWITWTVPEGAFLGYYFDVYLWYTDMEHNSWLEYIDYVYPYSGRLQFHTPDVAISNLVIDLYGFGENPDGAPETVTATVSPIVSVK
jgi:hypothetical protein